MNESTNKIILRFAVALLLVSLVLFYVLKPEDSGFLPTVLSLGFLVLVVIGVCLSSAFDVLGGGLHKNKRALYWLLGVLGGVLLLVGIRLLLL